MAAKIEIKSTLNSTQYKRGIKEMKQANSKFGDSLSRIKGFIVGAFSLMAIKQFIGAGIRSRQVVEDLTVQFEVLFKSADRAANRMEDLKKFSGGTPFQLEDIAKASQTLEVFSEGVLGGVSDLKLFGDAAAATGNKDLKDMSFWVGRLYASLKSGRPFIDSANALQRLRVLGPSTLKTMIEMSEQGKSGAEIWATYTESLTQFEGGMEKMSQTVSGKISTMKDNWALAMADMGKQWEGFTKGVLDGMILIAQEMPTLSGFIARSFEETGMILGREIFNIVQRLKGKDPKESGRELLASKRRADEAKRVEESIERAKSRIKTEDAKDDKKKKDTLAKTQAPSFAADRILKMGGIAGNLNQVNRMNQMKNMIELMKNQTDIQKQIEENTANGGGLA